MTDPSHVGNARSFIHWNPDRVDYTITPDELSKLADSGKNTSKEVCLVSASIGLPCIINAIKDTTTPFSLDLPLFLNYLIGALGIFIAIISGINWSRTKNSFSKLITEIRNKPKFAINIQENSSTKNAVALAPTPPTS